MDPRTPIVAVALAALLSSCGRTVCAPGETQACVCPSSAESAQVCADDGRGWQPCACEATDDDDAVDDDDSAPDLPQGEPAGIELGVEVTCADPEPPGPLLSYTEHDAGLAFETAAPPVTPDSMPEGITSLDIEMGGGVGVADLDGDGHLDLLFTDFGGPLHLFLGDGALGFTEVAPEDVGLALPDRWFQGVSIVDLDGDGDLDLYLLARSDNVLLDNQGDGTFVDLTGQTGLGGGDLRSSTAAWIDFDGDGDLDAHVANHGEGNYFPGDSYPAQRDAFFVQGADGSFEDRIDDLYPYEQDGYGYQSGWFDADGDGLQDLYVANDMSSKGLYVPNIHLRNLGDDGFEVHEFGGLIVSMFAMGLAFGDMDNDLDFDVHVTQAGPTLLARNDRLGDDAIFTDISLVVRELGFTDAADISFSTTWFDHDNDGWQELHTTFSNMPTKGLNQGPMGTTNAEEMPDGLWLWDPETETYSDIAPELGVDDPGRNHAGLPVDLDRDGFAEILVHDIYEGPKLFASGCNSNAWLRVRLQVPGSLNRDAIGAEVELWSGGQPRQLRQVAAGMLGNFSSGPPEVHFGAGELDEVDLVVRWPDGSRTVNRGVPTRRGVLLVLE